MKPPFYSSLPTRPFVLSSHGTGDLHRIEMAQTIHHGTKDAEGRTVILVLEDKEAADVGIGLIGQLPVSYFESNPAQFERLSKFFKLIEAGQKNAKV